MGRLDRRSTLDNLLTLVWPRAADVEEITGILRAMELDGKVFARAGELSGGQQQRTSVARAIYNGRPILLADEPVSALDRVQGGAILRLLARRHETLAFVMHDVAMALEHCDRIVVLDDGRKILDSPARSLDARQIYALFGGAA